MVNTLQKAAAFFSDAETCHRTVVQLRWPDGVKCPHCGSRTVGLVKTRRVWNCGSCRRQFTVKTQTVMEHSRLGLDKWLLASWLVANCKNGISSCELARALGITQKSAWFLLHRIRETMNHWAGVVFEGEIEADETYIGGLEANKHRGRKLHRGRGVVGKMVVSGLLERGTSCSKVKVKQVKTASKDILQANIRASVKIGASVFTDSLPSYDGISSEYIHELVDHTCEYVRGNVTTNRMENFWCLLKRTIRGTYIAIDVPHLDRYLGEQALRFNLRKGNDGDRFEAVVGALHGKRLTYKMLVRQAS